MKRIVLLAALAVCACSGPKPSHKPPPPGAAAAVAKGVVEAQGGLMRVLAPRDGVIAQLSAQEGEQVTAGQLLAQMEDRQPRLVLGAADAELGDKRAQVEVAAAKAAGAEREAARLKRLAAADAATRQDAEQAETAAAIARGEHHQALQALGAAQAQRRLQAFEVEVRSIRAPASGVIVRRSVTPGAYVPAATPLYVMEPNGPRIVRAELDESFADQVRPGMTAAVTREFQSGKSWQAKVLRVTDVLAGPTPADEAVARQDVRVITVILALPENADLRLGQRVLVRFGP
jgi:RND family efflux transporter MFP subunit